MRSATRMSRTCGNVSNPGYVVYSIYGAVYFIIAAQN
jgi:hypothetical protein